MRITLRRYPLPIARSSVLPLPFRWEGVGGGQPAASGQLPAASKRRHPTRRCPFFSPSHSDGRGLGEGKLGRQVLARSDTRCVLPATPTP